MALVTACTGFEFGTTAGWGTGNAGNKIFDTITATPTITTSTPRTGTYALEVSASAASESVAWDTNTIGSSQTRLRAQFHIRFVTSLPGADSVVAFSGSGGTSVELAFIAASGKLQVQFEAGGASQVASSTVVADTWYRIELYHDLSANPNTMDWWIDGVAQTQLSGAIAASTINLFALGCPFTSATYTARYDDLVVWTDTSAITGPKDPHKVTLLSVDPAGTVTLSGTTGNFNTFTSNGTLAAWNATTARNNIDEIPPTIGASADGWVQITLAASDYVEMPMTSYTLADGESVTAVRMLAPGWATSTTAATIGFRSWNGTTETTLFATADPNFDNSTTAPGWVCKMLTLADVDTQAELDALTFRVGFSGDATPDIGIHAIYAEVAVAVGASSSIPWNPQRYAQARDYGEAQWLQDPRLDISLIATAANDLAQPLFQPVGARYWHLYNDLSREPARGRQRVYYDPSLLEAPVGAVPWNPQRVAVVRDTGEAPWLQHTNRDPQLLTTALLENELLGSAMTGRRVNVPATHADRREVPTQRTYYDLTLLTTALLEGPLLGVADSRHAAVFTTRRQVPQQRAYISDPSFYPTSAPTDPITLAFGAGGNYWHLYNDVRVERRIVPQQRRYISDPGLLTTALLENELLGGADTGKRYLSPATHASRRLVPDQRRYPELLTALLESPLLLGSFRTIVTDRRTQPVQLRWFDPGLLIVAGVDPLTVAAGVGGDLWRRFNTPATHQRLVAPYQILRFQVPPPDLGVGDGAPYLSSTVGVVIISATAPTGSSASTSGQSTSATGGTIRSSTGG